MAKSVSNKLKAAKQASLAQLGEYVDKLDARLKRADTLTNKSVKVLEAACEDLLERIGQQSGEQAVLTSEIKTLSKRLTQDLALAQIQVKEELAQAAQTGDIARLSEAINKSHGRLTDVETYHAQTLSGINSRIARLAKVIDQRLSDEAKARTELETRTQHHVDTMTTRIENVEEDSAKAIKGIGDKIVSLNAALQEQSIRNEEVLKSTLKVNDLENKHAQTELESRLKHHITSLEGEQKTLQEKYDALSLKMTITGTGSDTANIAASPEIAALKARIQTLETTQRELKAQAILAANALKLQSQNFNAQAAAPLSALTQTPNPQPEPEFEPEFELALTLDTPENIKELKPLAIAQGQNQGQAQATQTNPYLAQGGINTETQAVNPSIATESHSENYSGTHSFEKAYVPGNGPVEYNPEKFTPTTYAPVQTSDQLQTQAGTQNILPYPSQQDMSAPIADPSLPPAPLNLSTPDLPPMPVSSGSETPYTDPLGVADTPMNIDEGPSHLRTMDMARPGADLDMRFGGTANADLNATPSLKSTLLSRPVLRVAGISVLLLGASLLAFKGFIGGDAEQPYRSAKDKSEEIQRRNGINRPSQDALSQASRNNATQSGQVGAAGNQNPFAQDTVTDQAQNEALPPLSADQDAQEFDTQSTNGSTLQSAAIDGDPIAQFQFGMLKLNDGQTAEGTRLVRLAANQGLAAAQFRLAKIYEYGEGVNVDKVQARKLTQLSADGGNALAMHDLGLFYANGDGGVETNMTTAAAWFTKAAEFGIVDSQFNIASLSSSGEGVPQSNLEAFVWYGIAARSGDRETQALAQSMANTLSPEDLERGNTRIRTFKSKSINEEANGIFRKVPWTSVPSTAARSNADTQTTKVTPVVDETLQSVQISLSRLGYDTGTADGAMGPRTRTAITNFEKDNNMPETGKVTPELLKNLNEAAGV